MSNVILTSDDFGMSSVYNTEMLNAIRAGWLSSISLMVKRNISRQQDQVDALMELYAAGNISLGLHLEISADSGIGEQCIMQLQKFVEVTKVQPDYIDIHKNHLYTADYDLVAAICKEKGICFRRYPETNVVVKSPDETVNASFLTPDQLMSRLATLETGKLMEIVFHIGRHDAAITSALNKERENDLAKLSLVFYEVHRKRIGVINYKMI